MRCLQCKSFNEDSAKFCHNCGAGLSKGEKKAEEPRAKLFGKTVKVLFYLDETGGVVVVGNPSKEEEAKHRKDGVVQPVKIDGGEGAAGEVKQSYMRFIKQLKNMFGEQYYDEQFANLDEVTLKKEYLRLLERMWQRWRVIKK